MCAPEANAALLQQIINHFATHELLLFLFSLGGSDDVLGRSGSAQLGTAAAAEGWGGAGVDSDSVPGPGHAGAAGCAHVIGVYELVLAHFVELCGVRTVGSAHVGQLLWRAQRAASQLPP